MTCLQLKNPHILEYLDLNRTKNRKFTNRAEYNEARRTAYSLLSTGFYGKNGLYPITSTSLYKTYVQPVLMYGLEIVQPKQTNLKKLEIFPKNILKHILSRADFSTVGMSS
jgi:hypothetical protein